MNKVLDLSWIEVYNEVLKGNISWDEFNEYLLNLTIQAYWNGYNDCEDDKLNGH